MPGVVLNNSPSATEASQDNSDTRLGEGEEYASPVEEQYLNKVMALVHQALTDPKKQQQLDGMLHKATNLGVAIGYIAYQLLMNIYMSAKNSGTQIPPTVFLAQGGAVYQTIEMLLHFAESVHCANTDPDHVRETALGIVVDNIRKNQALLKNGMQKTQQQPQQQQGGPDQMQAPQMAPANPLSHAVGQGLQQQGLLSGA